MILQKHYELAKRAHYGTSFSPEKRADGIVRDYSAELENDLISIPEVERKRFQENYEKYFTNWLHAKSNCISTMIAGPANFPTRRAEKANRSEENRYKEFRSFRERALKAIEKKHKPESEVKSENWERFEKDIRRAALAFIDAKFKGGFGNPPLFQASIVNKIEVQAKNGNVEFVDPYVEVEKPPTALEIHTGGKVAPSFTLGNFSMVIGKAKSKKTFLLTGLAAAVASNNWALDCIKGVLPSDKRAVLYFDTEQSKYHLNRTIKRVLRQANDLENFRAFGLRKFKPAERLELIEFAMYNTPNLGFVFIDGIRDLLSKGINDEEEATELTSHFLKWTAELNIHIVTVLHQNKGDINAGGHIGTEMLNKAETTLSVTVDATDKDTSTVSCEMSRDLGFDDFAFRINDQGLPEPCEMPQNESGRAKSVNPDEITNEQHFKVMGEIFKANPNPKYRELWQAIKIVWGTNQTRIGDNKAKDFLAYYQQQQWISKSGAGYKYERAIF